MPTCNFLERPSRQKHAGHRRAGGILVQESLPGAMTRQEAAHAAPIVRILGGLTVISPRSPWKNLQQFPLLPEGSIPLSIGGLTPGSHSGLSADSWTPDSGPLNSCSSTAAPRAGALRPPGMQTHAFASPLGVLIRLFATGRQAGTPVWRVLRQFRAPAVCARLSTFRSCPKPNKTILHRFAAPDIR